MLSDRQAPLLFMPGSYYSIICAVVYSSDSCFRFKVVSRAQQTWRECKAVCNLSLWHPQCLLCRSQCQASAWIPLSSSLILDLLALKVDVTTASVRCRNEDRMASTAAKQTPEWPSVRLFEAVSWILIVWRNTTLFISLILWMLSTSLS